VNCAQEDFLPCPIPPCDKYRSKIWPILCPVIRLRKLDLFGVSLIGSVAVAASPWSSPRINLPLSCNRVLVQASQLNWHEFS
jgi:hypothetical protein